MTSPGIDLIGPLASLEIAPRLDRLRARLEGAGCDALLVTNLANVRYLTGFTGSAGMLLVTPSGAVLTTDGRYRTQAGEQLEAAGVDATIEIGGPADQHRAVAAAVTSGRNGSARRKVGLEANAVTWATQRSMAEVFEGSELVPTSGVVEGLRRVKDPGERSRIEAAARVADEALSRVVPMLSEGRSEREVATELDFAMRRLGAEDSAFETIVAGGPNGAKPHARPGPRAIGRGDLVVIDFGAKVDGYRSDMTRTLSVGDPADDALGEVWELVLRAQAAGAAAVAPGVAASAIDDACREMIDAAGYGDRFVHSTGHGVGLDIHEAPAVAGTSADTLEAHSVVTVEPGVYLPDVGGVRIEDTLIITEGGARAVTGYPKLLTVP